MKEASEGGSYFRGEGFPVTGDTGTTRVFLSSNRTVFLGLVGDQRSA